MRKSVILTATLLLLGGCTGLTGPPRTAAPPAPVPARVEPPVAETQAPPQAVTPPRATPRPAAAVRIDNTSIESFRASWERLRASLSPTQQTHLNNAVVRLTFAPYGGATNLPPDLRNSPMVPEMIRHRIDGLTYAEIVALAQ
jgi:hypothetical protein